VERERSENGAELTENWVSGNGTVSGCHRKRWSVSGAGGAVAERERSGERGVLEIALNVERLKFLVAHSLLTCSDYDALKYA